MRFLAIRRTVLICTLLLAMLSLGLACSANTRYRVLSFFFDGVPRPGEAKPTGYAAPGTFVQQDAPDQPGRPVARRPKIYAHQPYRDNRCGGCHDSTTGQLFRLPEEGLCTTCHRDVPGQAVYVHGPVAVNACLFCHHHHSSTYPHLLLDDPAVICLRCHESEHIAAGEYHATIESRACTECHDAHGGSDRFFLKRSKR
ncbi:MAG: cytochrome c3 family protein [Planctomycetota bacterium]